MDVTAIRIWIETRYRSLRDSSRSERGAGLVEYTLLLAVLALAVVGAIVFLSGRMSSTLSRTGSSMT